MKQIQQSQQHLGVFQLPTGAVIIEAAPGSGLFLSAALYAKMGERLTQAAAATTALWPQQQNIPTGRARRSRKPAVAAQSAVPNYSPPIQRAQRRGRGRPAGSRNRNRQATALTQTSPQ